MELDNNNRLISSFNAKRNKFSFKLMPQQLKLNFRKRYNVLKEVSILSLTRVIWLEKWQRLLALIIVSTGI
jgi:hypothetical protein